jgi:hypothetical protein
MAFGRVAAPAGDTLTNECASTGSSNVDTPVLRSGGNGRAQERDRFTESLIGSDARFLPYRRLAVRVLARAVLDVMDPAASFTDRESARVFLAGSAMLRLWCQVAALNPDRISRSVERVTAGFVVVSENINGIRTLRESDSF